MDARDFTEQDIETFIQDGHQYLKDNQYEQAEQSYLKARQAVLVLKTTIYQLNDLDRMIRRARDQARWYEQITQQARALVTESDPADYLAWLERMELMVGQIDAMGYYDLANVARSIQNEVIASLDPQKLLVVAQLAMDKQDYGLVVNLLEGIQLYQDSPAFNLLHRARHIFETDVQPNVLEASQFLMQSRPLEGLGPLQDIRRAHPGCPAWRETWFALARTQGEFWLEHGRQSMSEAQYPAAQSAFKKALRAFERGAEAYPDTHSTQMLLTEAQDLYEIAKRMDSAYAALQSGQDEQAWHMFGDIQDMLESMANQGREYSLIQYEIDLFRQRLIAKREQALLPAEPQRHLAGDNQSAVSLLHGEGQPALPTHYEDEEPGGGYRDHDHPLPAHTGKVVPFTKEDQVSVSQPALRQLTRRVWQMIEMEDWVQAQNILSECESKGLGVQESQTIDTVIQAGLRLAKGRQLLEQGEIDLAIPRLESAVQLAENCDGAEIILADARVWLQRAIQRQKPPEETPSMRATMGTDVISLTSPGQLTRVTDWMVHVEPSLAQARAAFLIGDHQTASKQFLSLSRKMERWGHRSMDEE